MTCKLSIHFRVSKSGIRFGYQNRYTLWLSKPVYALGLTLKEPEVTKKGKKYQVFNSLVK